MSWDDWVSDPIGSLNDAVVNPVVDATKGAVDAVTEPLGGFTNVRDSLEAAGVAAGNYFLPGSSLVTGQLVSDGAKQALGGDLGQLALMGGGLAGGFNGNMGNYGTLGDMFSSTGGSEALSGTDLGGPGAGGDTWGANNMAADAPAALAPTVGTEQFGQGSNTGVDWANAPNESAAETARLGTQNASATGVPVGQQSLSDILKGYGSSALTTMGNNKLATARIGAGLYDMYAKNQMAKKQQQQLDQNRSDITNMYAAGSPELKALQQEMARKDAAAGRNSQYGTRATDLAGIIAKYKTNALSGMQQNQNTLMNQQLANRYGGLNSLLYSAPQIAKGT
jgi:hypothetical protein